MLSQLYFLIFASGNIYIVYKGLGSMVGMHIEYLSHNLNILYICTLSIYYRKLQHWLPSLTSLNCRTLGSPLAYVYLNSILDTCALLLSIWWTLSIQPQQQRQQQTVKTKATATSAAAANGGNGDGRSSSGSRAGFRHRLGLWFRLWQRQRQRLRFGGWLWLWLRLHSVGWLPASPLLQLQQLI